MKLKYQAFLIGIFSTFFLYGQESKDYQELVGEAWSLYESKEYLRSAQTYNAAFRSRGDIGGVNDRYNSACSWALAEQPDSAFVQLFRIAEKGNYTNLNHLTTDPDLTILHEFPLWIELVSLVKANKEKAEENFDRPLVAILDSIYLEDQKYRMQIDEIAGKHGHDSDEMTAHWKIINAADSVNLIKVRKVLDERGWLGADVIGGKGNQTLFLVIQHADIETQKEYLPMMRDAVEKGHASPSTLALLEDRVALREGRRQIYGSQISRNAETGEHYVLPLDDPKNVDARRAGVGLGPLADYVSRWDIEWDPEVYLRKLPEIEALDRK